MMNKILFATSGNKKNFFSVLIVSIFLIAMSGFFSKANADDWTDCVDAYGETNCLANGFSPSYSSCVSSAGSYEKCVSCCAGDSGDCYMSCGDTYNATGSGGIGSGAAYGCDLGYIEDPKDSTSCIPDCKDLSNTDGRLGYQYSYNYDECRGTVGATCLVNDDCGSGLDCSSSNSCELNMWGNVTGGEFSNASTSSTGTITQSITNPINIGGQALIIGSSYDQNTGTVTSPSGTRTILTPAQISTLNSSGALRSSVNGSNVMVPFSCGAGFEPISGVCFPTNTGLADPDYGIGQILTNLLSWLMGIFSVLALAAFIISGIQYLMSAGDEGLAETAKHNATNAVIGIIVGLSGFIIIKAISTMLTGTGFLF